MRAMRASICANSAYDMLSMLLRVLAIPLSVAVNRQCKTV
jgi:hypothetical protein